MSVGILVLAVGIAGTVFFTGLLFIMQPVFKRKRKKMLEELSKGYE